MENLIYQHTKWVSMGIEIIIMEIGDLCYWAVMDKVMNTRINRVEVGIMVVVKT